MTRRRKDVTLIGEIQPDQLYGTQLAPALFNLGWQACKNKIRLGKLPRPAPLNAGSKLEAWSGSQILEHRRVMRELAEQKAVIDAARPKQKQPEAFKKKKTTKVKLRARRGAA
jgi:hypothetical protein